jgi:carbamate kinase
VNASTPINEDTSRKIVLVAIGGNSITRAGQCGTIAEQFENIEKTCEHLVSVVEDGYNLVITHGNGPQVGASLLRSELAQPQVYPSRLDVCVADTQGSIGYMLQSSLQRVMARRNLSIPVATVVTQVIVDENDPAFTHPSKPIGPFYSQEESERKQKELGWKMVEDAARGYRRVVPSPLPVEVVEIDAIRRCVHAGMIVIAAGGGGIPVVRRDDGWFYGLEAVIDKDRASALLARQLKASIFIISTDAERVALYYKTPRQHYLDAMSVAESKHYAEEGHFPAGSMGPKIEAAIDFLEHGGQEVIITSPENLSAALHHKAGTRITR